MPEQVSYSYYDTAGNFIWCGTVTGIHVIRATPNVIYPVVVTEYRSN